MSIYQKYFTKEAFKQYINAFDQGLMKEREQLDKIIAVIYHVGDDEASEVYLRNKVALAKKFDIDIQILRFPTKTSIQTFTDMVQFNQCYGAKNIPQMVQFPVPWKSFDIQSLGLAERDIDGLSLGSIVKPCTAVGIMDYIKYIYSQENISIADKNIVIINRSDIVGNPLYQLALSNNMNVTQMHSYTSDCNMKNRIQGSDIIVTAIGNPFVLTDDYATVIPRDAMIFDVGISHNIDGSLCGDWSTLKDRLEDREIAYSPVPGGVGLLTSHYFIKNILTIAKYFKNQGE